mmetsp:Transcript_5797/g.24430  ORF Transcript_5797/g.24430 Transcript_5797/m.24430 type:complete len:391 (+) Transcript_5797:861-2033(+)
MQLAPSLAPPLRPTPPATALAGTGDGPTPPCASLAPSGCRFGRPGASSRLRRAAGSVRARPRRPGRGSRCGRGVAPGWRRRCRAQSSSASQGRWVWARRLRGPWPPACRLRRSGSRSLRSSGPSSSCWPPQPSTQSPARGTGWPAPCAPTTSWTLPSACGGRSAPARARSACGRTSQARRPALPPPWRLPPRRCLFALRRSRKGPRWDETCRSAAGSSCRCWLRPRLPRQSSRAVAFPARGPRGRTGRRGRLSLMRTLGGSLWQRRSWGRRALSWPPETLAPSLRGPRRRPSRATACQARWPPPRRSRRPATRRAPTACPQIPRWGLLGAVLTVRSCSTAPTANALRAALRSARATEQAAAATSATRRVTARTPTPPAARGCQGCLVSRC